MSNISGLYEDEPRPRLNKWVKYILIGLAVIIAVWAVNLVVRIGWQKYVVDSALTYNETQYNELADWEVLSSDYTEHAATVTKSFKTKTVKAKVYSGLSEEFIEAEVNGQNLLFHKKDSALPQFTESEKIVRAEIFLGGEYVELSSDKRQKLLGHLAENKEETELIDYEYAEYEYVSTVRIIYNQNGVELCNYLGDIAQVDGDLVFVPSLQDEMSKASDSAEVIPLPFDITK